MVVKRLAKESAVYGLADFFSKIVAFFTFPIIAAKLSPAGFGYLELIITTTGLLSVIASCGINNAVHRYYWDIDTPSEDRPLVVSSGLAAHVAFGSFAALLGFLALPLIEEQIQISMLPFSAMALVFALLLMVFNQWSQYVMDIIRLHLAPWRFAAISVTSRVGSALAGVWVVVSLGWGIDGLLVAQAIVVLIVLPFAVYAIRRDLTGNVDWVWFRALVKFGHPFIYVGLAYWLFGSMDRWMLATMSTVEEVGIYSVAYRFATAVLFVSAAFGQAWSPVAMKIRADQPEDYRKIYAQVLLLLLFVMLFVGGGMALFSGELIGLVMSADYADSAVPLAILSFGIVLQATQQVTAVGISIEKRTAIFARLAWITAGLNFLLNWLLIPWFGGTGAAWATFLSYFVLSGSYLYFTQRLHPLQVDWVKLSILLSLGGVVLMLSILMNRSDLDVNVLTMKSLVAIGCVVLGWQILPLRGWSIDR